VLNWISVSEKARMTWALGKVGFLG